MHAVGVGHGDEVDGIRRAAEHTHVVRCDLDIGGYALEARVGDRHSHLADRPRCDLRKQQPRYDDLDRAVDIDSGLHHRRVDGAGQHHPADPLGHGEGGGEENEHDEQRQDPPPPPAWDVRLRLVQHLGQPGLRSTRIIHPGHPFLSHPLWGSDAEQAESVATAPGRWPRSSTRRDPCTGSTGCSPPAA